MKIQHNMTGGRVYGVDKVLLTTKKKSGLQDTISSNNVIHSLALDCKFAINFIKHGEIQLFLQNICQYRLIPEALFNSFSTLVAVFSHERVVEELILHARDTGSDLIRDILMFVMSSMNQQSHLLSSNPGLSSAMKTTTINVLLEGVKFLNNLAVNENMVDSIDKFVRLERLDLVNNMPWYQYINSSNSSCLTFVAARVYDVLIAIECEDTGIQFRNISAMLIDRLWTVSILEQYNNISPPCVRMMQCIMHITQRLYWIRTRLPSSTLMIHYCSIINKITVNCSYTYILFSDFSYFMKLMMSFRTFFVVQGHMLRVLTAIVRSHGDNIDTKPVSEIIVSVMKKYPTDEIIQKNACKALGWLYIHSNYIVMDALPHVMLTMHTYKNHPHIISSAARCLSCMAGITRWSLRIKPYMKLWNNDQVHQAINIIIGIIRRYSNDVYVLLHAYNLLRVLISARIQNSRSIILPLVHNLSSCLEYPLRLTNTTTK